VSVYRAREAFHSVSFGELHVPATRCHRDRVRRQVPAREEPGIVAIAYIRAGVPCSRRLGPTPDRRDGHSQGSAPVAAMVICRGSPTVGP